MLFQIDAFLFLCPPPLTPRPFPPFSGDVESSESSFVLCQICKEEDIETIIEKEQIYEDRNIGKLLNFLSVACIVNLCQWRGKLEDYKEHLEVCPVKTVDEVQSDGHSKQSKNKDQMDFLELDFENSSSNSMIALMNSLKLEFTNLQKSVTQGQEKFEVIARKTDIFEGVSSVFQATAEKVLLQCEEVRVHFARQERENQNLKSALETQRNELLLLRREIEQRPEESVTNVTGTLVWKITDFHEKRRLAVAESVTYWLSPIFQTSQYGYRMQLKIYLNGDGTGKNKYISLFFIILKSEFDNILSWPFQQKVRFTALDQSGRGQHVMDAFRPDLSSSSFQKPVGTANIATGCPLFLPLQIIEGGSESRESGVYVKDDSMFIKATVDRSGLE